MILFQLLHGGLRPRNSLKANSQIYRLDLASLSDPKRQYESRPEYTTRSGNNVLNAKPCSYNEDWGEVPSSKRRRVAGESSASDTSFARPPTMDNRDELVMFDAKEVEPVQPLQRQPKQTSSNLSRGPVIRSNQYTSQEKPHRALSEYRNVHGTMHVDAQNEDRARHAQYSIVTREQRPTTTVDLCTDDGVCNISERQSQDIPRETRRGHGDSADLHDDSTDELRSGDATIRSKHFPRPGSVLRVLGGATHDQYPSNDDRHTTFVRNTGEQRTVMISDSPDELQTNTNMRFISRKPRGSLTSISHQSGPVRAEVTAPPERVSGLPESSIPRTQFTSSRQQPRELSAVPHTPSVSARAAAWAVSLKSFSKLGIDLFRESDCGLVYDSDEDRFYVQRQGMDLSTMNPQFSIDARKICSALIGTNGSCKISLQMSRSGNFNGRVDIELNSPADVRTFADKLHMQGSCRTFVLKDRYVTV